MEHTQSERASARVRERERTQEGRASERLFDWWWESKHMAKPSQLVVYIVQYLLFIAYYWLIRVFIFVVKETWTAEQSRVVSSQNSEKDDNSSSSVNSAYNLHVNWKVRTHAPISTSHENVQLHFALRKKHLKIKRSRSRVRPIASTKIG